MIEGILVVLILLYVLGFISLPGVSIPNYHLFTYNGHNITLFEILIAAVILWLISNLPYWLKFIIGLLLLVWILATFGIIAVPGLAPAVLVVIIVGVFIHRTHHWYHRYRRRYD